jgi:hypothetical protein
MKRQLIDYKQGRKRKFSSMSILFIFFLEWVPGLSPKVEIIPHRPCDPSMSWWTEVMRLLGSGRVPTPYNDEFFLWWCRQVIALDGYPYARIDYKGDPYMLFPLGSAYGDIVLAQGQTQGSTLQQHTNKALTTGPFDNICEANEVSPEVKAGVVAGFRCLQP